MLSKLFTIWSQGAKADEMRAHSLLRCVVLISSSIENFVAGCVDDSLANFGPNSSCPICKQSFAGIKLASQLPNNLMIMSFLEQQPSSSSAEPADEDCAVKFIFEEKKCALCKRTATMICNDCAEEILLCENHAIEHPMRRERQTHLPVPYLEPGLLESFKFVPQQSVTLKPLPAVVQEAQYLQQTASEIVYCKIHTTREVTL